MPRRLFSFVIRHSSFVIFSPSQLPVLFGKNPSIMISPLRIAIDGRSLCGQRAGVGTYTSNLLEQLLLLDPALSILLLTNHNLPPINWTGAERVQVLKIPDPLRNNFIWSNLSLRRELGRHSLDVFHSPGYTLPLWLRVPTVVSIHDVSYAVHPEWYPYSSGAARRAWYRLSARSADCVFTVSEFSRREIVRAYGIPEYMICVIPQGVDRRRFRRIQQEDLLKALRQKHRLRGDFLLFVGDIHRRRNVERIVEAFSLIRAREFPNLELVLIGRVLDSSISAQKIAGLGGAVRVPGYVPEEDLALFYSLAKAFVFPSFYEGFGLGVLEAMACGCPVIVSKGTACEEVAGEAAICVDPKDSKSIADAAALVLRDPTFAAQHSEAGLKRSEQFSWAKTAEETRAAYQRLLSRQNRTARTAEASKH